MLQQTSLCRVCARNPTQQFSHPLSHEFPFSTRHAGPCRGNEGDQIICLVDEHQGCAEPSSFPDSIRTGKRVGIGCPTRVTSGGGGALSDGFRNECC